MMSEAAPPPIVRAIRGLPTDCTLSDLEGIILPRISGRIVAIGLRSEGTAVIEFARISDAGARSWPWR